MTIDVKLDPGASMPERAKAGDVGYDLRALHDWIVSREGTIVPTGVHIALPMNVMGLILGRSSLAALGIDVLGGVIDPGYRGEIGVVLQGDSFYINAGDRIAQLVFVPVLTPELVQVDVIDETERGEGGFGSTGR